MLILLFLKNVTYSIIEPHNYYKLFRNTFLLLYVIQYNQLVKKGIYLLFLP